MLRAMDDVRAELRAANRRRLVPQNEWKRWVDAERTKLAAAEERLFETIMLRHAAREENADGVVRRLQNEAGDGAVLDAIRDLGLVALRPLERKGSDATSLSELQRLIWARVAEWYRLAREGEGVADRRRGAASLLRLGRTLAGDRRGRRSANRADPIMVCWEYKRNLRRLQRARELLRLRDLPRRSQERIALVAKACRIPRERLLLALNLDPEGRPRGRSLGMTAQARIWIAQRHRITEQTVSNILSALGRDRRSRK